MVNFIKYFSRFLSIILLFLLIFCVISGETRISDLLGFDITNIYFTRGDAIYDFSLVEKFPLIACTTIILAIAFFYISLKAKQTVTFICNGFHFFKQYTIDTFHAVKSSTVKFLLLIPFGITLYMAYTFPNHVDEAMTYFDFIKRPIWEAFCLYPAPNNHIFYSVIANLTERFTFLDLAFRIRIPSILASLFTWILAYRFVKKYYSENVALFVVAVGSVMISTLEYSYMARGYSLVMFFIVICIYSAFNIVHQENRRRDWTLFTIASILGAWTVPSFLYPFITVSIYILFYNYKNIKTQILYTALVGLGVFLLYSPILLFSGIESLSNNRYVAPIDRIHVIKSIPGYISGLFVYMLCANRIITIFILALPILYSLYKKDKNTLLLWGIFFIIPSICLMIHSVLPFFRVFFYYGFIFSFLFALSFRDIINKITLKILIISLLTFQILMSAHFYRNIYYLERDAIVSREISDDILQDNKTYYVKRHLLPLLYSINLAFEAERKGYTYEITMGDETDMDKKIADYDYCLILGMQDETKNREPDQSVLGVLYHTLHIYKR